MTMIHGVNCLSNLMQLTMDDVDFRLRYELAKKAGREAMKDIPGLRSLELKPLTLDFSTCIPKCTENDMNPVLVEMLEDAWRIYPFRINSGFRSPEWERKHSRPGTSAHCLGKAVDINTPDSRTRWYVVSALLDAGFTRIGFGKSHVHVDIDVCNTRPDRCIFLE